MGLNVKEDDNALTLVGHVIRSVGGRGLHSYLVVDRRERGVIRNIGWSKQYGVRDL